MTNETDKNIISELLKIHQNDDPKTITRIIPHLIKTQNAQAAYVLVCSAYNKNHNWLPEALTLFNIKNLSLVQKRKMLETIFAGQEYLSADIVIELSDCNARIGRLGFSFPQWRFLTQGFNGASLVERFGMQKRERITDVRDPTLPRSNPDRDEYGIGFVDSKAEWTIEYRRAYILCSHHSETDPATLIIRNNSYFFGRDRLPAPVFVSWKPLTPSDLLNLDRNSFDRDNSFIKWQDAFSPNDDIPTPEKLKRTTFLLNQLDSFDMKLSLWLQSDEGLENLKQFQNHALAKQPAGKTEAPFYLAWIDANMPPWFPSNVIPAHEGIALSQKDGADKKLVLLSGPDGDLPLKPQSDPMNSNANPVPSFGTPSLKHLNLF